MTCDNYFMETFKSPFLKDTKAEADEVLEAIREAHPASAGWQEMAAYIEYVPNEGKWRAVRKHRKLIA